MLGLIVRLLLLLAAFVASWLVAKDAVNFTAVQDGCRRAPLYRGGLRAGVLAGVDQEARRTLRGSIVTDGWRHPCSFLGGRSVALFDPNQG